MKIQLWQFVSFIILFIAVAMVSVLGYFLFYPYDIVHVKEPIKVINKDNLKTGDFLELMIEYDKHLELPTHTIRTIQCKDGNLVTLTPTESNFPIGQNVVIENSTVIPQKTSVNTQCKLVLSVTFEPNFIRKITETYETEWFFVNK